MYVFMKYVCVCYMFVNEKKPSWWFQYNTITSILGMADANVVHLARFFFVFLFLVCSLYDSLCLSLFLSRFFFSLWMGAQKNKKKKKLREILTIGFVLYRAYFFNSSTWFIVYMIIICVCVYVAIRKGVRVYCSMPIFSSYIYVYTHMRSLVLFFLFWIIAVGTGMQTHKKNECFR